MLTKNPLKEKLSSGKPALGTWNTLASPMVTEVLAHAGLDFVIVDFEHGPYQLDRIAEFVSRAELHDCSPIVRIPSARDWMALQALDQGAHGVLVPHCDDEATARAFVSWCKYHPEGIRGYTPFTKAGGFAPEAAGEYAPRANANTLTAVLVESKAGLDRLDAILETPGLDVVYFGAYDLSQALGAPGKVYDQAVVKAIEAAVRKTVAAGKNAGGFVARNRDDLKRQLDMGMTFLTYDVDTSLLRRPVVEAVAAFKELVS